MKNLENKVKEIADKSLESTREEIESFSKKINDIFLEFNDLTHKTNQDIHHKGLESYQVFVSEIEKLISDKKEVLNQTISKLENEIGEKIHTIVHNEINSLVVEDIKKKGTIAILDEFNHALKEIDQSERNTIIVAIKALLNKNVLQGSFIDDRLEVKKLPSDTIFHKHYNRLKTCILSGVAPMIVGPAGSGKSLACEQIAKEMGLHFYVANRVQNSFELTGFVNAQGKYVTTQFYEAYPPKSIAYKISDSMGIRILDMPNHYLNVSIDHKNTKRYQLQFHDEEESQYYGETEIIKLDPSVKSIGKEEKKDTSDKLLVNPNLKRRMFSPFELISREVRNIYLYLPKTITMLLKKNRIIDKGKFGKRFYNEDSDTNYLLNQIYVLMTCATRRIYIYCEDKVLTEYFKNQLNQYEQENTLFF